MNITNKQAVTTTVKEGEILLFCPKCGEVIDDNAVVCPKCGLPTTVTNAPQNAPANPIPMYTPPAPVAPPKKKKGCLIAVLVGVGLIVLLVIIIAVGGGGSEDDTTTNKITSTQQPTIEKQDVSFKVLSGKVGTDYAGKPVLFVEYEFTNNTSKATSFTFSCQDTAYQNGIECGSIVIADDYDTQQQLNDIKPGVAYKLTVGYVLQDTKTNVDIEITDLFATKTYLKYTFTLN